MLMPYWPSTRNYMLISHTFTIFESLCYDHGLFIIIIHKSRMLSVVPLTFCNRHLKFIFHIYKYRQNYLQIWAIKRDNHKIFGFVNIYQEYDLFKTFLPFLISCPLTFLCQIKSRSIKKTPALYFLSSVLVYTDDMRKDCCTRMVSMGAFQKTALMKPVFGLCQPVWCQVFNNCPSVEFFLRSFQDGHCRATKNSPDIS